ncbi:acyl-CoA dehydrogenase family protein [Acetobacter orientalis]|uniref:acyl-CoA dehydrogenase family protein n=1 Tax=Acetobacter orientalis TaxID=146474 RepID=UPI0039E8E103
MGISTQPKLADGLTVDILHARAQRVLASIAQGAADRERERRLPYEQIKQLASAQLLTFRIPKKYGGAGGRVQDVIRFLIDLASVDSNTAQALRPAFAFIEDLLIDGSEAEKDLWFQRFLAGEVVGNAGWEVGGANGAIATKLKRDGNSFRVNGSKYYSTGGLYADWIAAVALDENDQPTSFIVPREREGLILQDDFDAMGQRLTASGTTTLHNVVVYQNEIRRRHSETAERTIITPFFQLYLGAVEAGIALNVLKDAVDLVKHHVRPIKHSSAEKSADDPYVRHTVGEIAARAYAAEAVVMRAATSIDHAWENNFQNGTVNQAAIEVAKAQFVAIENTLKAAEIAFDVGGASATARKHNLDRHWRNARTVANHNPRDWKAAVVGAWEISGEEPPRSGLF